MGVGEKAVRHWVAEFKWPGKRKFYVGTVELPAQIMQHELDASLFRKFQELWGNILPDGVPLPQLVNAIPGAIVFVDEQVRP
ncbi:hypothetical protein CN878_02555 [Ochrobactrum sp. 695/2009]|nr:hypothetical protein [Brucella intermedia]PJR90000.1 hypothetical protein CN881_12460 [Ochrobactrum sp. 721/2009]PJT14217.1 hypothetical protein CN880_21490 [Ochrobactrum sp. 720/2009]PJT24386.1 hypothetical protein CN879_08520 [Ochrobactrum sp. 715/2009]PJT30289.1 hypothetical protein CN878_02555 [Ochrobactrum sp. 695/2009]PJT33816.1 hypothetical protein CN877_09450 [Ochrobactrum sp. 689/2009]